MKFTWKKIFGSLTGPPDEPPVKCPICCVNCTPMCAGYPNCDFPPGCVCAGDGIATNGPGPSLCYCCKEITTTICNENCLLCECPPEGACPCPNCDEIWCDSWSSIWCTDCVWTAPFPDPPIGNPGGPNSCNIVSNYKPYTYRIDLNVPYGGYTGFSNRILNGTSYGCPTGGDCGNGSLIPGGCDPDLARPYVRRYHKSPVQASVGGITGFGVDYACLSWVSDKKSRVMVFSGRNVYRYSGFLSGGDTASNWATQDTSHQCTSDAYISRYYPWIKTAGMTAWTADLQNPIGISGIAEMESLLGRPFPLEDRISGLPLWGQPLSGSLNQPNSGGGVYCGSTASCVGCECLTASNGTIGHYDSKGYTGSGVCFNPQAYVLDGFTTWAIPQLDYIQKSVPLCSVWSFIHSMFHFGIYQAYVRDEFAVNGVSFDSSSSWIQQALAWYDSDGGNQKTTPGKLIRAYKDFLSSTPDEILNGFDGGTYYGNALTWHLRNIENQISFATGGSIKVSMPSVFLWDQSPYESASGSDKYKHIYIIGNANILFDSTCAFPSGATNGRDNDTSLFLPSYATRQPSGAFPDDLWATDDVRYHILRLDEVNHNNSDARPGLTSSSARLIVFPGCSGGQTAQFDVNIKKLSAVAVHGDDCVISPTPDCPVYQIESDEETNGVGHTECACAICANLDNNLTWDYDPNNGDQRALPACWANPSYWDSNPTTNRYLPHPYMITNPLNNKPDCRYFGPHSWITGKSYFTENKCRGFNIREI